MLTSLLYEEDASQNDASILLNEALFQKISNGDKEAFRTLYLQTYRSVYGFLLSIVQNQEDAEDLLQETYIRVRLHADRYSDQGKPLAWIFTIARNLALMRLRENKRASYEDFDTLQICMDFHGIDNAEDRMVLETAFRILDQEERTIVLLHAVTGMKHREISELLSKPLATILSKYRRAIKKLQKELAKNGKE